jgi:geranyl-CoA carboxylase alpha subunit
VLRWQAPAGARVDSGLFEGLKIGAHYDSMQAKLIVHGQTRDAAVRRLLHALDHTVLLGVTHNRDFLRALAADPAFTSGQFSTGFIGAGFAAAYAAARTPARTHAALAALALYLLDARALARQHALADEYLGWHSSHATPSLCTLGWREQRWSFGVAVQHDGRHAVTLGADTLLFAVDAMDEQGFAYTHDGLRQRAHIAREGTTLWLDAAGRCTDYQDLTLAPAQGAVAGSDGRLLAHSDGRVAAVHVQAGDTVAAGQTLLVLEAMKMEFQLSLPVAGNVGAVHVQVGQQVRGRQLLLSLT